MADAKVYTVAYDTPDGLLRTATFEADSVEMDAEYVKFYRSGAGVVFAVNRGRFATLHLEPEPKPAA